jgi:formylglycine-generating enzyme required for sulfatase activity
MTTQLLMALVVLSGTPATAQSVLEQHDYELVRIEPGEFLMGSAEDQPGRNPDEDPHRVQLTRAFEMGATEVTARLYQAVVEPPFRQVGPYDTPVHNVTWKEAVSFCILLSVREGLQPAYRIEGETVFWDRDADGYRLPTEAEWEYAARAGQDTVYAGSDRLEDVAWYDHNTRMRLQAVGGKQANAWGLHDMSGNVYEWVWDGYGDYPDGRAVDPVIPPEGFYRVLRGGSVTSSQRTRLRVTCRERGDAGIRVDDRGFRIVRTVPQAEKGSDVDD